MENSTFPLFKFPWQFKRFFPLFRSSKQSVSEITRISFYNQTVPKEDLTESVHRISTLDSSFVSCRLLFSYLAINFQHEQRAPQRAKPRAPFRAPPELQEAHPLPKRRRGPYCVLGDPIRFPCLEFEKRTTFNFRKHCSKGDSRSWVSHIDFCMWV